MSDKNEKGSMTSVQLKKQLKSINTDKTDIKHSLIDVVDQFQCLDRIARSVGLVREGFSFVNRISWKAILSKLDQPDQNNIEEIKLHDIFESVTRSSNQLEKELIPQLQRSRNIWMYKVILFEFLLLSLFTVALAVTHHMQGLWNWSDIPVLFQSFIYVRPTFSLILGVLLFVCLILIHFKIRNFVAKHVAEKLNNESLEFDLAGAFLKNTRIQHSIFRPDIIGWGWLNRKCLRKKEK